MMDLLKTPSVQSLLDSDLESVESLQYLDIEELDEVEYALPASEAPTLAEVLCTEEEDEQCKESKYIEEPATCSALQVDFLQAVSQQLLQAEERSSAGPATALSVGTDSKLTVGTAHGHLLSFHDQTLRWVCDSNIDRGAVSCLAYNHDCTRLLVGYARGLICQYESIRGTILRRVTLGGEIWGALRVTWAGTSGLALDTGGSVWLIKFSRPLGVRSSRTSCLFSGARGEVVTMAARNARILALATLSRVIIVAGGRAAGLRLIGPADTLPVLEWSETDEQILVCARAKTLQWLSLTITGANISLRPVQRVELSTTPLWLGWLGGSLAIFDADENLRLWGEDYEKPLDLSHIETVYASAFFKGHWTDGRVSRAMCTAGVSALGGASVSDGALSLLGRRGIVRVRPRNLLARAQAFLSSGRHLNALKLLCSTQGAEAKALASHFLVNIYDRPQVLSNKQVADQTVKLCLRYDLMEELWNRLWDQCSNEKAFVEALGDAAVRGELSTPGPSPDYTQGLIEKLAEFEPELVDRVIASLPLTSIDPHRASLFTREKGLWRAVGAIAAALGGGGGAMHELMSHVSGSCGRGQGGACSCAGWALVVAAADALAGRGAAGRPLPDHAQPSARHDALLALLSDEGEVSGRFPLRVMVEHDAAASVRLLEQSARDPPFVGPLGKQNRLRVARSLLTFAHTLPSHDERTEIIEFLTMQLNTNALPSDQEVITKLRELSALTDCERADRAWLSLLKKSRNQSAVLEEQYRMADQRPRVLWHIDAMLDRHGRAIDNFFNIVTPTHADVDELFEYLRPLIEDEDAGRHLEKHLPALIKLRPRAAAGLLTDRMTDSCVAVLRGSDGDEAVELGRSLLEAGRLSGEAAILHLRNLCRRRPRDVRAFLAESEGLVRPEEALATVRVEGPPDAEPLCLEAVGDHAAALDAVLRVAAAAETESEATSVLGEAAALCSRVAPGLPRGEAVALWLRLVRVARVPPAALLLEAAAYLPVAELVGGAGGSARGALALLRCAGGRRAAWACVLRVSAREAHECLSRSLVGAGRGLAVRGACVACGRRLAGQAVRTGHCARATHAACDPELACGACGRLVSPHAGPPPPRAPRHKEAPPPHDFELYLVAPPRPDLEGSV